MKILVLLAACFAASLTLEAQTSSVVVSGLNNPSKLILTPGGDFLVTETGTTPNSGKVTRVTKAGAKFTLLTGLPSGLSAPNSDADGTNGLALDGTTLYIANGEGDGFVNGTTPGTILPNPAGPSSPLFTSIIKLTLPMPVDQITGTFTLQPQDHYSLLDGTTLTMKSSAAETATLDLVTANRISIPDPMTIYRNSHPYGLALVTGAPTMLYMVDAGMNALVQINPATGRAKTIVHFGSVPSYLPAPPVAEAVPDSVKPFGSGLLVTLLSGYPFGPYASQVVYVDPATGKTAPFIENLAAAIDIAWNSKTYFVLSTSANLGAAPPLAGGIIRYDTPLGVPFASNINSPTSMVLDTNTSMLYVTSRTDGTIIRFPVQ